MKIFYSWQSDTPSEIGKNFVLKALKRAVAQVTVELELNERGEESAISIDQDTQGVLGSPSIIDTICQKIGVSDVVLLDVTLIGRTSCDKPLVNSNVAFELGYTHGVLGDHPVLQVMNTFYGEPDHLPFDLRNRRWPVQFKLSPDCDEKTKAKVLEKLSMALAEILTLYSQEICPLPGVDRIASTDNAASYWQAGELLLKDAKARGKSTPLNLGYTDGVALIYLRVSPSRKLDELSGVQLREVPIMNSGPFRNRAMGWSDTGNKYGRLAYNLEVGEELGGITQVFKNREIWGVDGALLANTLDPKLIPIGVIEESFEKTLKQYLMLAFEHLDYGESADIEAGMVNVTGRSLALSSAKFNSTSDPVYSDEIIQKAVVMKDDRESLNSALVSIFERFFDAAGLERPSDSRYYPIQPRGDE